jgi:hypothetical protein
MMRVLALPFILLPALAVEDLNPVSKVLDLLEGLAAKITQEGVEEAKTYKEFKEWCKDAATNKGFEIRTHTATQEKLEATIAKASSEIEVTGAKLQDLAGEISVSDVELANATAIRKKEAADFAGNDAELVDVIQTLGRAITLLER